MADVSNKESTGQSANHAMQAGRTLAIAGLKITEKEYRPRQALIAHEHEQACLYFVVRGNFREQFGRESLCLDAGSLGFRPAARKHANRFGDRGACCLVAELPLFWLERFRKNGAFRDKVNCVRDQEVEWLGLRMYRELRIGDSAAQLAVEGILLEMLARLCRSAQHYDRNAGRPAWLERATDVLANHCTSRIQLKDVASFAGVHPVHLAREFRKHHGCTVGQYLRQLRIRAACRELEKSRFSLAELALQLGFANQAHFSRIFKLATGVSPAKYRDAPRARANSGQNVCFLKDDGC